MLSQLALPSHRWPIVVVAAAFLCSPHAMRAAPTPAGPQILTQDIDLFYRVYDAAAPPARRGS